MNCRSAKAAINERTLGRLASGRAVALEAHLRHCAACASIERADRWVVDELASLRGQIPYTVDVRRRVMIEIERFEPLDRQEVSPWQLGWATAVVGLCRNAERRQSQGERDRGARDGVGRRKGRAPRRPRRTQALARFRRQKERSSDQAREA